MTGLSDHDGRNAQARARRGRHGDDRAAGERRLLLSHDVHRHAEPVGGRGCEQLGPRGVARDFQRLRGIAQVRSSGCRAKRNAPLVFRWLKLFVGVKRLVQFPQKESGMFFHAIVTRSTPLYAPTAAGTSPANDHPASCLCLVSSLIVYRSDFPPPFRRGRVVRRGESRQRLDATQYVCRLRLRVRCAARPALQ